MCFGQRFSTVLSGSGFLILTWVWLKVVCGRTWGCLAPQVLWLGTPHGFTLSSQRERNPWSSFGIVCLAKGHFVSEYLMCARSYSVLYLHMLKFT